MRLVSMPVIAFFLGSLPLPLLAQTAYVFEVDTTRSSIDLHVTASAPGVTATDEATSRLAGSVTASLTPPTTSTGTEEGDAFASVTTPLTPWTASFSAIHITDMDLTLRDSLNLRLDFGSVVGRLDITAPPDEVLLALAEAGEPAPVTDTTFTQTDNTFSISGTLDLDATGFISIGVGDSTVLNSQLSLDITGSIVQTGDTLRLRMPLATADTSEISGISLILTIDGLVVATSIVVGTDTEDETLPANLILAQNYPNPFNPRTSIAFTLDQAGPVTLRVYDTLGRLVATLVDGALPAGPHEAVFDAADLPSGIYVYRLVANGHERHRTMVLLK